MTATDIITAIRASTRKLPRCNTVVVVDDGAERWVGNRREIYGWISGHGYSRRFDRSTNIDNTVKLDADAYQDLCDSVTYAGRYDHLTHKQIETLRDRGAVTLTVL